MKYMYIYLWFSINTRYKDELSDEHAQCQVGMDENTGFLQESESIRNKT